MIYGKPKFLFISWRLESIFKSCLLISSLFFLISNPTFCYADSCSIVNVGASYGDGTVFCVSNTSDTSQCVTSGAGYYGLFMANEDQVNYDSNVDHGVHWASIRSLIGATSASDGVANTAAIVAALPSDSPANNAAWLCHNYTGGGYIDWYLPAKDELNKMYLYANANNLIGESCIGSKVGGVQCFLGGLSEVYRAYWSSTEYSSVYACRQLFSDGNQYSYSVKDTSLFGVRAVRAFNYSIIQPFNTLSNVNKSGYKNNVLEFTSLDFTNNFSSTCGNSLVKIKITSLPANGVLKLAGASVSLDDEIALTDLANLIYEPNSGYVGNDSFSWNGSDDAAYASSDATVIIEVIDACGVVKVGANFGGGTVFCVSNTLDTSQCVTTGSGKYGLFMANEDQVNYDSNNNHGIHWSSVNSLTNATADSDGVANTAAIIGALPSDNSSNNAAWLCHNYTGGGYTDWYLPSKNELNKIYFYATDNNLIGYSCNGSKPGGIQCLIGGADFGDISNEHKTYWSSTESSDYTSSAWSQGFGNGYQYSINKDNRWFGARAVRSFDHSTIQPNNNLVNINKSIYESGELRFTALDFTDNFSNTCGTSLAKIKITSLPVNGVLKLSEVSVSLEDEINVADLANLTYEPNSDYVGNDSFNWNGSDDIDYADSDATVTIELIDSSSSNLKEGSRSGSTGITDGSSSNVKEDSGSTGDIVPPTSSSTDPGNGGNVGAIVGGVVGGAIVATVVGAAVAKGIHYYYHHHVRPIAREIGGAELGGV